MGAPRTRPFERRGARPPGFFGKRGRAEPFSAHQASTSRLLERSAPTISLKAFTSRGSIQVFEYAALFQDGLTISSNAYGSVFFLTTGFHGLHVIGGLIAFLVVLGRSFSAKKFGHHEATTAIVVSYYWHFVDVVWIVIFTLVYLIPA